MTSTLNHYDDDDLQAIIRLLPDYDPHDQAGDCWFDAQAARDAIDFFPDMLKHSKGPKAGRPFDLEDWQKAVVANLFGWKRYLGEEAALDLGVDADTVIRRFTLCWLYVAKKNGKSCLLAGILLYGLIADGEIGAEIYSVAAAMKQAGHVFDHLLGFVKQNEALDHKQGGILRAYGAHGGSIAKSVVYDATFSKYQILASDADSADGTNPSMVGVDEVHRHKSGELIDVLLKSMRARIRRLAVLTTTADWNRDSVCNRYLKLARAVCANKGDKGAPGYHPEILPVVYECTMEDVKGDGLRDPEVWRKANPNLGITFTVESFRQDLEKVRAMPEELNNLLRLSFNIVTDSAVGWLPMDRWDECEPELAGMTSDQMREPYEAKMARLAESGRPCYGGLDLASHVDLEAYVIYFPAIVKEQGDQSVIVEPAECLAWFWIPQEVATEYEKRDVAPYTVWARQGWIETTPGERIDQMHVARRILQLREQFWPAEVGYDPRMAEPTRQHFEAEGFPAISMAQNYKVMSPPSKEVAGQVADRALKHGGHPVLRMCAANTTVARSPDEDIRPVKGRSSGRIDGIPALVMARACADFAKAPKQSLSDLYAENPDPIYA